MIEKNKMAPYNFLSIIQVFRTQIVLKVKIYTHYNKTFLKCFGASGHPGTWIIQDELQDVILCLFLLFIYSSKQFPIFHVIPSCLGECCNAVLL